MNQSSENVENFVDELWILRINIINDIESELKIIITMTIKFIFSNVSVIHWWFACQNINKAKIIFIVFRSTEIIADVSLLQRKLFW